MSFTEQLQRFTEEFEEIQREEIAIKAKAELANQKFFGWLKEMGMPENTTVPAMLSLAARKAKEGAVGA